MPRRNRHTFAAEIQMFRRNTKRALEEVHDEVVDAAHTSITVGSPHTGSRGQPVGSQPRPAHDPVRLRDSWVKEPQAPFLTRIFTTKIYAPIVEFDAQPFRSEVGGPHALSLTRRYWQALVAAVVAERTRGARVNGRP